MNVTFNNGAGGTTYGALVLDDPSQFSGTISGFAGTAAGLANSDEIDLAGINYNSGHFSDSYNSTTGVLTVTDGTNAVSLTFIDFSGTFKFASDGNGGTDIFDPPATQPSSPSVSVGGPGNDSFVFRSDLGTDSGNVSSPTGATDLERHDSAPIEHWLSLFSAGAHNDVIEHGHAGDGMAQPELNAAHWHLTLQNAVLLH